MALWARIPIAVAAHRLRAVFRWTLSLIERSSASISYGKAESPGVAFGFRPSRKCPFRELGAGAVKARRPRARSRGVEAKRRALDGAEHSSRLESVMAVPGPSPPSRCLPTRHRVGPRVPLAPASFGSRIVAGEWHDVRANGVRIAKASVFGTERGREGPRRGGHARDGRGSLTPPLQYGALPAARRRPPPD